MPRSAESGSRDSVFLLPRKPGFGSSVASALRNVYSKGTAKRYLGTKSDLLCACSEFAFVCDLFLGSSLRQVCVKSENALAKRFPGPVPGSIFFCFEYPAISSVWGRSCRFLNRTTKAKSCSSLDVSPFRLELRPRTGPQPPPQLVLHAMRLRQGPRFRSQTGGTDG